MANIHLKFRLIICVCLLVVETTKGVFGECRTPPVNQAVYKGTKDIIMTCNSPNKVTWSYYRAKEGFENYDTHITDNSDAADTAYPDLFRVNETNLIIKVAQSDVSDYFDSIMTTSGLYHTGVNDFGAKLVIVKFGPWCFRFPKDAARNDLSCDFEFLDNIFYNPIYAKLTWTLDGNVIREDAYSIEAFSTITVDTNDTRTYKCTASFTQPILQNDFTKMAMNAPDFTASCNPPSETERNDYDYD